MEPFRQVFYAAPFIFKSVLVLLNLYIYFQNHRTIYKHVNFKTVTKYICLYVNVKSYYMSACAWLNSWDNTVK